MKLSNRTLVELASHEGAVLEAYKDTVGVWTWGVGVTNASGHEVHPRYKDNPQSLEKVLEIFEWLAREKYLPAVLKAFKPLGRDLEEHELAAALSFHYNTGGIGRATWVKTFCAGDAATAKKQIMNWKTPSSIIGRRKKERDLFFDGKWSNNGMVNCYDVRKPSYKPYNPKAVRVEFDKPEVPPETPPEVPPEGAPNRNKFIVGVIVAVLTGVVATLSGLIEWLKGLF